MVSSDKITQKIAEIFGGNGMASVVEEAFARRFPEAVVLVTTRSPEGKPNIITLGWWMRTSHKPPMVAISVAHKRFSYELLVRTGEFVLVIPPEEWADAAWLCGTKSGRDVDKFSQTGLKALNADKVSPPLIEGAVAQFECVVRAMVPTGDHTVFAGEVVAAHLGPSKPPLYSLNRSLKLGGVRAADR